MLNKQDQKFITNAFEDVRKILIGITGCLDKAEECLSYLTDVYLEYDPEKTNNFPYWAAQRCTMRFKDSQRTDIGPTRYNNYFKSKKLKEIMSKSEEDSEEYIKAKKELQDINPLDNFFGNCSLDQIPNLDIQDFKDGHAQVDWEDAKNYMFEILENEFPESKDEKNKTKRNMIYKTLIKEYLIPKSEGAKHITLEAIAQRSGVCIATVTKLKNDHTMKNFIKRVLQFDGC